MTDRERAREIIARYTSTTTRTALVQAEEYIMQALAAVRAETVEQAINAVRKQRLSKEEVRDTQEDQECREVHNGTCSVCEFAIRSLKTGDTNV
jgi:cytochrome c5